MDPVTHGLIGASASASVAESKKIRLAALAGGASAMLPDLDVFLGTPADPLLNLELHRQFTHALIFIPAGALIASLLLWWFVKQKLTFPETYRFSLLGFATAGLADTFTSYGVQLGWPFTDDRFSWDLISVFDPLFSLGLVLAVVFALYKKKPVPARLGLCWAALYLLFGFYQQQKTRDIARQLASRRNHTIEQLIVKPTIANELLWSIRYVSGDSLYADGVRLWPFSEPVVYEGSSIRLLPWRQRYDRYQSTTLYEDIRRFSKLSGGILIAHPDHKQVIGDGRYAMLPTSVSPLWGIKADTTRPGRHVPFNTYRDASKEVRQRFIEMLLGN